MKLTRHEETVQATRARMRTHSHLMCKKPEPRFETCLCELTVKKHIFLECSTYQNARAKSNIKSCSLKEAFGGPAKKKNNRFHRDGRDHNEKRISDDGSTVSHQLNYELRFKKKIIKITNYHNWNLTSNRLLKLLKNKKKISKIIMIIILYYF